MSGENASQGTPLHQQQMVQSDYVKLLDDLFLREQYPNNVEVAFELFEKNFGKILDFQIKLNQIMCYLIT
jgi:hypothetical protein